MNHHFHALATFVVSVAVLSGVVKAQTPGLDAPQPVSAYFNGVFPLSAPGQATGWETVNAFPNLTFVDPLWLTEIPGTSQLLLVGKNGQLWRFENNVATAQSQVVKVLEWGAKTQTSEDQGFYSLVFHPEFGQAGSPNAAFAYVCYNHKPALPGADANHSFWRVSRFTWLPASGTLDPNSEFVLMNQYDRCRWHNGGAMFFDNQGFLNITCGDGGDSGEGGGLTGPDGALSRTQRIDFGLFSGIFRIDVDNDPAKSHPIRRQPQSPTNKPAGWPASYTQGYGIPNDNPWQDPGGSILEEFHSIGLRSPHTAHFDATNNEIWIGDVGEGQREEMTMLPMGGNAEWGYKEGNVGGPGVTPASIIGVSTPPTLDYSRGVGTCIIGGMRYRGAKWDGQLGGKILYGDHVRGRIWTATLDEAGSAGPVIDEIVSGFPAGNKVGLANFCVDSAGEIYLLNVNGTNQPGGTIRKLSTAGISTEPPRFLSQTGVFTDLSTLSTAPGVIPYNVANPLWSDGADKQRWIILPNDGSHDTADEKIIFSEEEDWIFPAGTVFVKHFEVPLDVENPASIKKLETRFLICTENGGKYGFTYKWNKDGTDAELLTSGESESYKIAQDGGVIETRNWDYPSRADCMLCHNNAAGQALGARTPNLNRSQYYSVTGRSANQLQTFNALGMFDRTLTQAELLDFIEARSYDDPTAPLEHRVRSYLDANCSHCHQPDATVEHFDARLAIPLAYQGIINGTLKGHFSLGPDGRYIKPGDPLLSAIHVRMENTNNAAAMPPLAKNLGDAEAIAMIHEYINALDAEEFETTASPLARYVRLTALSEVNGNEWTSVGEFTVLAPDGSAIPFSELSIFDFDSEETEGENSPAVRAIDGDPEKFWHTRWFTSNPVHPHHLTLDLGSLRGIGGYEYTPRQINENGRIASYQIHHSQDGVNWTLMDSGTWPNNGDVKRNDALTGKRKARCEIGGPASSVGSAFDVTVVFDMDVSDFTLEDLEISGGSATKLRGKGYYYVATILPSASTVTVSVPPDAANLTADGLGSRQSNVLSLEVIDTQAPVPVFTDVPAHVTGPFQIGLTFGEIVTGLTKEDFTVINAEIQSITPSGPSYLIHLLPGAAGTVGIEIRSGAVTDTNNLVMGQGTSAYTTYLSQILARDASEYSYIGGGMVLVSDPNSPNGAGVWLPDGAYPNNFAAPVKTQHRAEYQFVVPHAGQWQLRGLIHSADASSDSFWVEIDGNQATRTVYLWDTGPVATSYQWDYLNNRDGANPVTLTLSAGPHTISVYGRDDGTRLARLELESLRPRAVLSGPSTVVTGPFTMQVSFSESVTGLNSADFTVNGAAISSLSGTGRNYTLSLDPNASLISVTLPENSVIDGQGNGNFISNSVSVRYRTEYEQWAFIHHVDGGPDTLLADEDKDGIEKLLEYAFNLDPSIADWQTYDPINNPAGGMPRFVLTGTPEAPILSLQFIKRRNSNLSYIPQFGSSPEAFSDATGTPAVEPLGPGWERVTIPDENADGELRRFGRVKVIPLP